MKFALRNVFAAVLCVSLVGWSAIPALGQGQGAVSEKIQWKNPIPPSAAAANQAALSAGPSQHVVLQFKQVLSPSQVQKLASEGTRILDYLGANSYFALVKPSVSAQAALESAGQVSALNILPGWKLHPDISADRWPEYAQTTAAIQDGRIDLEAGGNKTAIVALYVVFHRDIDLQTAGRAALEAHGGSVRDEVPAINALVAWLPKAAVSALAAEDAVQWIEPPLPPMTPNNNSNRIITQVDEVQAAPYGLSGTDVNVLVYDAGTARASHVDFGGRLTVRDASGMLDHPTHVAGTIGGDGTASGGLYHGMAPGVTIQSYGFEYDGTGIFLYTNPGDANADYDEAINTYGAELSNNSIGSNIAPNGFPCEYEGDYGVMCSLIDEIVRGGLGAPMRIVWSNGNENNNACGSGYHLTPPPATAKNHITVGAVNSNDDSMTVFSSWGPTDDGRIKPDVVGPGCQGNDDDGVTSCVDSSDTAYGTMCGTSMSGPTVTGICALILEDWKNLRPLEALPRNSMMKVLLAHNAVDLGNPGPDYVFGFGSVRAKDTIDFMRSHTCMEDALSHGEANRFFITVTPGTPELKVTLAWDDFPGTLNTVPELVNDLDLEIIAPDESVHYPWTLDPSSGNEDLAAVRTQADHANNIEQVLVDAPSPGLWKVRVVGFSVPEGPQAFSVIASPDLTSASSAGTVDLASSAYSCEDEARVTVVDVDLNTDPATQEQTIVELTSTSEAGGELVTLTEDGVDSPVFVGTILVSVANGAGVLLVANGDTLTATYIDSNDGTGHAVTATDTAVVDCVAPIISSIASSNIKPREATITFTTDENSTGAVYFGLDCGALDSNIQGHSRVTSHSLVLTNLTPETVYYFSVHAEDEAGNRTIDDNSGSCYTFTTPRQPDYFTELFSGDNDLSNSLIRFTPNGSPDFYEACQFHADGFNVNPMAGALISLEDDAFAQILLTGGHQFSLYGTSYASVYVGSNGYITFGSGSSSFTESLSNHFSKPRVAACYDDLDPPGGVDYPGGTITFQELSDRLVVSFVEVPEYGSGDPSSFQFELYFDSSATPGIIVLTYGSLGSSDGLAGLSKGLGLPVFFEESDLTGYDECGLLAVEPEDIFYASGPVTGPFSPLSRDYTVTNTGSSPVDWSATPTDSWFDVTPASGTLAAGASELVSMSLTSATALLAEDFYSGNVEFVNTGDSFVKLRTVWLDVSAQMAIEPTADFEPNGYYGGPFSPASQTYTISNLGTQPIDVEVWPWTEWALVSPMGGTIAGGASLDVEVTLDPAVAAFVPGLYESDLDFVNLTTGAAAQVRTVSLTVDEPIGVSPATSWDISGYHGGPFTPPEATYTLTNQSGTAVDFAVNLGAGWLMATPASGHLESGQTVDVTVGLTALANAILPGVYASGVTFMDQTTSTVADTRPVSLEVIESLSISPAEGLNATGYEGGPFTPESISYTLVNNGTNPVNWAAVPSQIWVDATPSSGTLDGGADETVTVTLNAAGLPFGFYSDILALGNLDTAYLETRDINLEVFKRGGTLAVEDSIPAPDDLLIPFGDVILGDPRTEQITLTNTDEMLILDIYSVELADLVVPLSVGRPVSAVHIPAVEKPAESGTIPASIGQSPRAAAPASEAGGIELAADSPAYGINWEAGGGSLSQFTLDAPGVLNAIGSTEIALGGDFDNSGDFSTLYAIGYLSDQLLSIDTATGNFVELGTLTSFNGEVFTGMAMDPTSGIMYACSTDIGHSSLYALDLVTPSATLLGTGSTDHPGMIDIAVDNSGQLYGMCVVTDELVTIDKTTGATTSIGYVGFDANFAQGMDFDGETNTLYLAAIDALGDASLRVADTITGATASIGAFPAGSQVIAFGIATTSSQEIHLANEPEWPYVLQPGESLVLDVMFAPYKIGDYSGTVVIETSDPAAPIVEVGLTGTSINDTLAVTPDTGLDASGILGGPFSPASADYTLENTGAANLDWSAAVSEPWLDLSLLSGSFGPAGTATVTVSVNSEANTLAPGSYSATLTFTNETSGHAVERLVTLTVSDPLEVDPDSGYFGNGYVGGPFSPADLSYTLHNAGAASLDWSSSASDPWIDVVPPSGTLGAGEFTTVTVAPNGLAGGLESDAYVSSISFTDLTFGDSFERPFTLWIFEPLWLTLLSTPILSGPQGGPFSPTGVNFSVGNSSDAIVSWALECDQAWLDLSSSSGTLLAGQSLEFSATLNFVAAALPPGSYWAQISLLNGNGGTVEDFFVVFDVTAETGCGETEIVSVPLDSNPGWTTEGQWAFGVPLGLGGNFYGNPDPTSGATGTNVYGVNLGGDYSTAVGGPYYLTAGPFDCSASSNTRLEYQRWLNTDYVPFVTATVEVSLDGSDWTSFWSNPLYEVADSTWVRQTVDISSIADNSPEVYIRWGYSVDEDAFPYSGWNIDDVRLVSFGPEPLQVAPGDKAEFSGTQGGLIAPSSFEYTLENTSVAPIDWSAQVSAAWFEAIPASGTLDPGATVSVMITPAAAAQLLPQGFHNGSVVFSNTGCAAEEIRDVEILVSDPLQVTPLEDWMATGPYGGVFVPSDRTYTLTNLGLIDSIDWSVEVAVGSEMLAIDPELGTLLPGQSVDVTFSLTAGVDTLLPDWYVAEFALVNWSSGNGSWRFLLLEVTEPLSVTPEEGWDVAGFPGGPFTPPDQTYTISNASQGAIDWDASPSEGWLDVTPSSGSIPGGGSQEVTVALNATADALPPGTYVSTVQGSDVSTGTEFGIDVNLEVYEPLTVSPEEGLAAEGYTGGPFEPSGASYVLTNPSTLPISWSTDTIANWIEVVPDSGTLLPGEIVEVMVQIGAFANTMLPGLYPSEVTFSDDSNGMEETRSVSLVISASPPEMRVETNEALDVELHRGESLEMDPAFTIFNDGVSDLHYQTQVVETTAAKSLAEVEAAVQACVARSGILEKPITVYCGASLLHGKQTAGSVVLSNPEEIAKVIPGGPATGDSPNVAVLGGEEMVWLQDIGFKLLETGQFGSITLMDIRGFTPTLADLEVYSAILVFADFPYADSIALGDTLADYVDAGGGVVCSMFELAGFLDDAFRLMGRWTTGNYMMMDRSDAAFGPLETLGTVYVPGHPIMANVNSFSGGDLSCRPIATDIYPNADRIADWSDGSPLVSVSNEGLGRADIAFFPVSSDVFPDLWDSSTDGALLLANALTWTTSGQKPWLRVIAPKEGTIPGMGLSESKGLLFDATDLMPGVYTALVEVSGDDPNNPQVDLPCTLTVLPDRLAITPETGFENVGMAGGPFLPGPLTYTLTNGGDVPIDWSADTGMTPWLDLSLTFGTLLPGESADVTVAINGVANTFMPGNYEATLQFSDMTHGQLRERAVRLQISDDALIIAPDTGFGFLGAEGGPFAPSAFAYTVTNASVNTVHWRAASDFDLFVATPESGYLDSGASVSVEVALNNDIAALLTPNLYGDTLTFSDLTNFQVETRDGTLEVRSLAAFLWDPIGGQQAETPFDVSLAALDSNGEIATGFSGTAALSAFGQGGPDESRVVITEIDTNGFKGIEIQNVSGADVNTEGWIVALGGSADINDTNPSLWFLPSTAPAGDVLYRNGDPGDLDHYWGAPIEWLDNGPGWALIIDAHGFVVDFVVWGWTEDDVLSSFYIVPITTEWSGDGATTNPGTSSLQRIGAEDTNSALDFAWDPTSSLGMENASLTPPFPVPDNTIPMSPASTDAFDGGVWTGQVTINEPAEWVVLFADSGTGLTGFSNGFPVGLAPVRIVNVTSTLADGAYPAGQDIEVLVQFSEPVDVIGLPTLSLNVGQLALYTGGSGTDTLSFLYTVEAGDNVDVLDAEDEAAFHPNGFPIRAKEDGRAADVTLPVSGQPGSLSANKLIAIDTNPPTALCWNAGIGLDELGVADITPALIDAGSSDDRAITSMSTDIVSVGCADLGTKQVTLTVFDAAGNIASCVATVTVSESIEPIITLLGDPEVTLEVHSAYADAGVSAQDNCGDVTPDVVTDNPVDTASVGSYTVTYDVTDASGNAAAQVTRTVHVVDTTAPIITLLGIADVTVEVNGTYTDAGATASDNYDGDLTASIVTVNPVNTAAVGIYAVTYDVTDAAGNAAAQVSRTVHVVDTTAPAITLLGDASVTVEVNGTYTDAGATALDNYDGNLTASIVTVNPVNTAVVGNYTVTYDVTDAAGNAAVQVTRAVHVVDTTAPIITLLGDASVTVEVHGAYTDAGATALDNYDGDLTASIVTVNPVNTAAVGDYTITYDVTDAAGNAAAQVTRAVHVVDTTAPVITLLGGPDVSVEVLSVYTDAGATALDNYDGDLTADIVTVNSVNTAVLGDYTVTYNVTDAAGNAAIEVSRIVHVVDTTAPVITLVGDASVTVEVHGAYTDAGATALDNYDGVVTASIVTVNSVDTAVVGNYTVTYNVTDAAGNAAIEVIRTVHVVDTTAPIITLLGNADVTVEVHGAYTDAGATALDNYDGDVTADIATANSVNTTLVGNYTVTYNVTDAAGNAAIEVVRTVHVVDTTDPVITLLGSPDVTVEVHGTYSDAGATALDNYDGNLTSAIVTVNPVNVAVVGNYTVTYNVTDAAGNAAIEVIRTVHVVDTTLPVITLLGDASVTLEVHGAYTDAGATALDNYDGNLTSAIVTVNPVNMAVVGNYTVTYDVTDAAGNAAVQVTRSVHVVDTTAPVITLLGNASVTVEAKTTYTDAGATASDNYGGDLTASIVTVNSVNTAVVGDYTVTYNVSDAAGNAATQVTRTVHVTDTTAPVITRLGAASVTVVVNSTYTDAGATALDNYDGNISDHIVTVNPVDTSQVGAYTVTYNVSDAAGNAAVQVSRLVTVWSGLRIVSPADGSTLYVDDTAETAAITLTAEGPDAIESVTYRLDGTVLGTADTPPYALVVPLDLQALGLGGHEVTAVPVLSGDEAPAETASFTIEAIEAGDDTDNNGIPDDPFQLLALDGDLWVRDVDPPSTGDPRSVVVARLDGLPSPMGSSAPLMLAVSGTTGEDTWTLVDVPRSLVPAGAIGMLFLSLADDLETLFDADMAAALGPEPFAMRLVENGRYAEISLLVSTNGGTTFDEIDDALLEAAPLRLEMQGLVFAGSALPAFYSHPTFVNSDPSSGPFFESEGETWSPDHIVNQWVGSDSIQGELTALSVFAPLESYELVVPNVVGTAQASAQTTIVNAGLAVGTVTEAYSGAVALGAVISQNPAAGDSVTPGSAVNLVVSKGVSVPDVIGMTQAGAESAITLVGLDKGTVSEAYSETVPDGVVISQNPASGTNVSPGTDVAFVLSKGPDPAAEEGEGEGEGGNKLAGCGASDPPGSGRGADILLIAGVLLLLAVTVRKRRVTGE